MLVLEAYFQHFDAASLVTRRTSDLQKTSALPSCSLLASVRPICEFREMPITDINMGTHPITDTDIRYEGHSMAVGLLLMPYSFPPPRYSRTGWSHWRVGYMPLRVD